jgi:hypothetical protein
MFIDALDFSPLFAGSYIAAACILIIASGFFLEPAAKIGDWLVDGLCSCVFLAAAYCFVAGLFLLSGWSDPLAAADPAAMNEAASRSRGRGGIILIAISYWPYVLIGLGGYFAFHTWHGVPHTIARIRHRAKA